MSIDRSVPVSMMEEEEFEFLDNKRVSPTDFELIQPENIRTLDNQEIVVHEDYFLNDFKRPSESSSADDHIPIVKRSKRKKKSKAKALQSLTDLKSKIPPKINKKLPPVIKDNVIKIIDNKPSYSQVLQGVAETKVDNDEAVCSTEIPREVETMEDNGSDEKNDETIDSLLQMNDDTQLELSNLFKSDDVTDVDDVPPLDDVTILDEDSAVEVQLSETDEPIQSDETGQPEVAIDEELEERSDERVNKMYESYFTRSLDDYGLKSLFEDRLVSAEINNRLLAIKTSTLMVAITASIMIGIVFGNCFASIFMTVNNDGFSTTGKHHVKNTLSNHNNAEEKYILVKVDPAPPLFNNSAIWFGQPTEANLRAIFNEFRHLQRDHIRLQEAYNELKENMQLEKQMKWYWRRQARKDVQPLNSVKYTLHDGLMKVSGLTPEKECERKGGLNVSLTVVLQDQGYVKVIDNLTQSLEDEQKASDYWRGRYQDAFVSSKRKRAKGDTSQISLSNRLHMISKALRKLNLSSNVFNLSKPTENMVDQVRSAWRRLKNQWKMKENNKLKDQTRSSINRFRKMFSMGNIVNSPYTRHKSNVAGNTPCTRHKIKFPPLKDDEAVPLTSETESQKESVEEPYEPPQQLYLVDEVPEQSQESLKSDMFPENQEEADKEHSKDSEQFYMVNDISFAPAPNDSTEDDEEPDVDDMFHPVTSEMECKSVNATGDPSGKLKGLSCRSVEQNNISYVEKETGPSVYPDDINGVLVSIIIRSFGNSTNQTKCYYSGIDDNLCDAHNNHDNFYANGLKWFQDKYEQALFLSKLSKWRNSYEIKKAVEKGRLDVARVKLEKDNAIRQLETQQQLLQWKLTKLKHRMYAEKEVMIEQKQKYENVIGRLDNVLRRNERIMCEWKKHEKQRTYERTEKLIKRIKRKERSKTNRKIDETKNMLKTYIEDELKRIEDRRRLEDRNKALKTKLKKKVNYYKDKYEQSVEERTKLRGLYNEMRTEASIQKSIITNLIVKIKEARMKAKEYEKENKEITIQLQSYIDAITTSHVTGSRDVDVNEVTPHNEEGDGKHLSVRFPDEDLYKPKCDDEKQNVVLHNDDADVEHPPEMKKIPEGYENDNTTFNYPFDMTTPPCDDNFCPLSERRQGGIIMLKYVPGVGRYPVFYMSSAHRYFGGNEHVHKDEPSPNIDSSLMDPIPPRNQPPMSLHPSSHIHTDDEEDDNTEEIPDETPKPSPLPSMMTSLGITPSHSIPPTSPLSRHVVVNDNKMEITNDEEPPKPSPPSNIRTTLWTTPTHCATPTLHFTRNMESEDDDDDDDAAGDGVGDRSDEVYGPQKPSTMKLQPSSLPHHPPAIHISTQVAFDDDDEGYHDDEYDTFSFDDDTSFESFSDYSMSKIKDGRFIGPTFPRADFNISDNDYEEEYDLDDATGPSPPRNLQEVYEIDETSSSPQHTFQEIYEIDETSTSPQFQEVYEVDETSSRPQHKFQEVYEVDETSPRPQHKFQEVYEVDETSSRPQHKFQEVYEVDETSSRPQYKFQEVYEIDETSPRPQHKFQELYEVDETSPSPSRKFQQLYKVFETTPRNEMEHDDEEEEVEEEDHVFMPTPSRKIIIGPTPQKHRGYIITGKFVQNTEE